jgi:hypothetical protein
MTDLLYLKYRMVTDSRASAAWMDQAFGKKYFLMFSPSVLNMMRVPRS